MLASSIDSIFYRRRLVVVAIVIVVVVFIAIDRKLQLCFHGSQHKSAMLVSNEILTIWTTTYLPNEWRNGGGDAWRPFKIV
jgi:hypothetical protein